MQQLLWKNREQFFREQCEKISQIDNSMLIDISS